jgi:peptidyl-prolyl cis-trans isomerase B (cyclophilin B)
MEFVDAICEDAKVEDNNGTVLKKNQPVILSVRVVGSEGGESTENNKPERVPGNETYGEAFNANIGIDTAGHTLHNVEIKIEKYGIVTLTLDETIAPITVQNFIKLANEGYYDGLNFHRIIEGFMMQGGAGATTETIKGEFSINGVENPLLHVRGVISMARKSSPYDSATSQFFIMHEDAPHLDGSYAAFGWVTSGIEFVDAICEETPVVDNNGTVPSASRPKILSIRVVTE